MALVIRLRQQGRTNRLCYRLVVADQRSPRDGKYVEKLGSYDPYAADESNLQLNEELLQKYLDNGAMISDKAEALIRKAAPAIIKDYKAKKEAKRLKEIAKRKKAKASK
ncbi:MAG TPA: 30S ribosomal protein S16 [Chlamydiales bacterium]|nr:30S ribosomal protein S16 [Chlamydiales bacterium]